MREEVERKIKEVLGVKEETLKYEGVFRRRKRKGAKEYEYLEAKFYDIEEKKIVNVHVPVKKENLVLELDRHWKESKKREKELEKRLKEIISEYKNPDLIREILERLLEEGIRREAKDYAYEKYKKEALELFERFKPYLIKLRRERLKRINLLQALYLLANVKEMFQEKEEELEKVMERAVKTILFRDQNQKLQSPLGVLKNDFFLPKETPYDFLLSRFLQAELEPVLEKLLKAEIEKEETQEAMGEIAEFLTELSEEAKSRVLKVFPSFSQFSKVLYREWKKSGQSLKDFLVDWKSFLEFKGKEAEKEVLNVLSKLNL
ncbi:hypothetical protein [Aquifex aeolicus]|uniref:Uncharacterized protein aq_aa11 n=1 Tax=Aquifex aeolicus (strain VF5) TaxID=224324 RepID=YZ11_AQUAE|nr:hypothetical protein [Aquifex aeolicus]O66405.1 RecName: Full=Uncharacterized protein aq_aa11 [Aquifex aeolicus VF5]AAC07957.1 putative protein [Aquifex aeolicus VF5]